MSGETTDTAESTVDDRAPESAEAAEPAQPETETAKPETAKPETAQPETAQPETAQPEPVEVAPVPVAPAARASRAPVAVLAGVSAVLLVAAVVFGVLFVRERSARQQAERDLRGQTALANQRQTDLEAVRAQRAEIERKLATAEAQLLSPEAKAAISACVSAYAVMEKAMADAERTGYGSGSFVYAIPAGASPGRLCSAAEPHLAKLA